ncbi:hypothetical protein TanjilG_28581 [Lupinus angustifolius]|uniref:Uncharacterized protein n=1 Tax=Lupinus angustifolius TaxID=3871 RepID=A0A4P1RJI5_LUPAN|nr:hypothetical protein TanjilG_28581 [Lupinus angustifolius]
MERSSSTLSTREEEDQKDKSTKQAKTMELIHNSALMNQKASLRVDAVMENGKEAFETSTSLVMKRSVISCKDISKGVGANGMFDHTDEDEEADASHECFGSESESKEKSLHSYAHLLAKELMSQSQEGSWFCILDKELIEERMLLQNEEGIHEFHVVVTHGNSVINEEGLLPQFEQHAKGTNHGSVSRKGKAIMGNKCETSKAATGTQVEHSLVMEKHFNMHEKESSPCNVTYLWGPPTMTLKVLPLYLMGPQLMRKGGPHMGANLIDPPNYVNVQVYSPLSSVSWANCSTSSANRFMGQGVWEKTPDPNGMEVDDVLEFAAHSMNHDEDLVAHLESSRVQES